MYQLRGALSTQMSLNSEKQLCNEIGFAESRLNRPRRGEGVSWARLGLWMWTSHQEAERDSAMTEFSFWVCRRKTTPGTTGKTLMSEESTSCPSRHSTLLNVSTWHVSSSCLFPFSTVYRLQRTTWKANKKDPIHVKLQSTIHKH